jgi:Zn-finger nucleic acid-binding protein
MNCPVCPNERLVMSERAGVEIDYCPSCRGVWLDRGELDKIIERASAELAGAAPAPAPAPVPAPAQTPAPAGHADPRGYRYDDRYDDYGKRKKSKKSSILGEIFDF